VLFKKKISAPQRVNAVIDNKSASNISTFGETTCNNNGVKLIDSPFIMI
jgi:hypothetical protein